MLTDPLLANENIQQFIAPGLAMAKKYYNRFDNTDAYVIAMCESCYRQKGLILTDKIGLVIDPTIRFGWIVANWSEPDRTKARTIVLERVGHSPLLDKVYLIYLNNSQLKAYRNANTESAGDCSSSPAGSGSHPSSQPGSRQPSGTRGPGAAAVALALATEQYWNAQE
jgi:hypothetical protein